MLILGIDSQNVEAWAPVVGFDGYLVSSVGRVVSIRRKSPVVMSHCADKDGYQRLQLRRDGKHVHALVSRLVCEAFNGPPPAPNMVCCHNDGDVSNNVATNLRWDSQKGNIADKLEHGTHQVGDSHPRSVITAELARKVKDALRAYPRTRGKLLHAARLTGAPYWIVADISAGKAWRNA